MRTKLSTIALLVAVLGAGCAPLLSDFDTIRADRNAEYVAACDTFTGAVNAVTVAREQGAFTAAEAASIDAVIQSGEAELDAWRADLDAGRPRTGANRRVLDFAAKLTARLAGKGGENGR